MANIQLYIFFIRFLKLLCKTSKKMSEFGLRIGSTVGTGTSFLLKQNRTGTYWHKNRTNGKIRTEREQNTTTKQRCNEYLKNMSNALRMRILLNFFKNFYSWLQMRLLSDYFSITFWIQIRQKKLLVYII